jgi:phage terminase small subunit
MSELTAKQQRFVDEYLIDLNATQAAIRAGYSEKTARQIGEQNLSKLDIQEAIRARMKDREQRTKITQDMVLQEYAKIAFLDPRRFYDENGALIPVQKLPADVAAALSAMEVVVERNGQNEDGSPSFADVKKIKFADKKGALDSVARHLGMFNDKMALTGAHGGPMEIVTRVELVALGGDGNGKD